MFDSKDALLIHLKWRNGEMKEVLLDRKWDSY